jgi:tetratricopeptide (TPR) repeat protein
MNPESDVIHRRALTAALDRAVDACRRWPQATAGVFYPAELLGDLAEAYEGLGRTDDALATMQAAIDAGYTGAPDPRCRLAEILLRAGRAEEAHLIFTEVKAETPDDVWLYNNAGLEYGAARDHERHASTRRTHRRPPSPRRSR